MAIGCPGGAPCAVPVLVDVDRLELEALRAALERGKAIEVTCGDERVPRPVPVPPALPLQVRHD